MQPLYEVLRDYGPWALVLVVAIYILMRGELTFHYPRREGKNKN